MNGLARLLVEQAVTFGWILSRVVGFVLTSPFPGAEIPSTARVTLVLSLAWVVASFATPAIPIDGFDLRTLMSAALELGCGLTMGMVFRLLLTVGDMAGEMIAHAVGLSTGAVLNPDAAVPDPTLTRIVSLAGMLVAIGLGAHRVALGHLLESFRSLPVGSVLAIGAVGPDLASLAGEMLATSVRLALPVVAVCLLTQLGMALVARAAPAMQIFNVGLAITIAAGLLTVLVGAQDLGNGLAENAARLSDKMGHVLLRISSR